MLLFPTERISIFTGFSSGNVQLNFVLMEFAPFLVNLFGKTP